MHNASPRFRRAALDSIHRASGGSVWRLPEVLGIGVGENHVKVTVLKEHPSHSRIPSSIHGYPVVLEVRNRPRHHTCPGSGPGNLRGGVVSGGVECPPGCSCTGIVSDATGSFILSAAHCMGQVCWPGGNIPFGGKTVAVLERSALKCGSTVNHLDASIARLAPGVQSDRTILGLGTPSGLAQPVVGDTISIQGPFAGALSGTVTTINYEFQDIYDTLPGNCVVYHTNLFEVDFGGENGDSGSCGWNQNSKIVGLDMSGDGNLEQFCNLNYLQAELGVSF